MPSTHRDALEGLEGLGGLPGLPGMGRKQKLPAPPEALPQFDPDEGELGPLQTLTRALGDAGLAQRVLKLQAEYPVGSVPELVTYDWLRRRQSRPFQYQVALFGGRARSGGLIPDFIIDMGTFAMVWLVQGNYWHNRPGLRQRDAAVRMALMGARVGNQRVGDVVQLWESKINDPNFRPRIFQDALAGIELGP